MSGGLKNAGDCVNKKEWDESSSSYQMLAISSARAAVALEEWERVASSMARHEGAFFSSIHDGDGLGSAWRVILSGASGEFCEKIGAAMCESESGWAEMAKKMAGEEWEGRARINPKNIERLLFGLRGNKQAPIDFWKAVGSAMIDKSKDASFRSAAPWGVSSSLCCSMWHECWHSVLAEAQPYERAKLEQRAGDHLVVLGIEAAREAGAPESRDGSWREIVERYADCFAIAMDSIDRATAAGLLDNGAKNTILEEASDMFCWSLRDIRGVGKSPIWAGLVNATSADFSARVLENARKSFNAEDFSLLDAASLQLSVGPGRPPVPGRV